PSGGSTGDPPAFSLAPLVFLVTLTPLDTEPGPGLGESAVSPALSLGGTFSIPPSLLLGLGSTTVGGVAESGEDRGPGDGTPPAKALLSSDLLPADSPPD